MNLCHAFVEPANTTDAYRNGCGTCGGDRRLPLDPPNGDVDWSGGESGYAKQAADHRC